jgi:glyoxylase-like metal-dependent hydrolase (beta-lactamase superfamily II)
MRKPGPTSMPDRRRPCAAVTRRDVVRGAGAAVACATLGPTRSAFAAAPHRLTVGAFELTVVSDGHLVLPTSFLAPDAPAAERAAILADSGENGAEFNSPTNCTLIRAGNALILIDTGSGPHFMPTAGKLADNFDAAGIDRRTITMVVYTHGHPDHLWGVVDDFEEPLFPQASYVVAAAEWDFWHGANALSGLPAERAGFVTGARRSYAHIKDKVRMVKPGDEIVSGLRVLATPGHTQGHVSLEVAGGDGLVIGGDALTHALISFRHPEWRPQADHVPDLAASTRTRLLDRLATDRMKLIGFHLPYPGVGYVERTDGAYRFVAT